MGGYETFAVMVRRWRHIANLTQEELAERSGLSPRSIQNLEHGRVSRPRRDSVRLLADALGLTGADRAAFEHAARLGAAAHPTPWRGHVTGLRKLVSQTGRQPVDLRGLSHSAPPEEVLDRLLAALGVDEPAEAVAV
ncbi:helix-turn-helix domain-containing protein [Actinophytocola sp. KF-1]